MSFLYDRLMRIHLITAESPASRRLRFGRLIQFPQLTMPLIAALTPPEHEVAHTDEIVERVRFDAPADLVGITAPTPSALHAYDIARQFRRRGVPVVIGGPHATALPEEAARHADAVVVGEAEDTWPRLLDDARRGRLEQVYVSSRQAPLVRMPAPRWDLIKGRRYGKSVTIATRGCPHRCDYCSIPLLYGPATVRYRPIDEVVREVATSPTRAVVFWDDNIGANPRYAKELFRALAPLGKWWTSQCTANAARDEQLVELAARSGCKALFLGLESISQESLDATNKGHNRVDAYRRLTAYSSPPLCRPPSWRPERSGSRAASTRRRRSSAGLGVRVRGSGGISLATWATCSRVSRRGTPLQVRATKE